MHERLDIESKRRTNAHNILPIQFLQDRSLARVIQPSTHTQPKHPYAIGSGDLQKEHPHLLLLLPVLPDNREQTHYNPVPVKGGRRGQARLAPNGTGAY